MNEATPRAIVVDGADASVFAIAEHRFRCLGREAVSFLETDTARNIDAYLGLKGRCGRVLENADAFLARLADGLRRCGEGIDLVVCPQSRRDLNARLAAMVGRPVLVLPKRGKEDVMERARALSWRREEWASMERRFAEMGASLDLHKVKPNQRKRLEPLLFDASGLTVPIGSRLLLLDDSLFSGTTLSACLHALDAAGVASDDERIATAFWCRTLVESRADGASAGRVASRLS